MLDTSIDFVSLNAIGSIFITLEAVLSNDTVFLEINRR